MNSNPFPKWKQDRCPLCEQGVPMPIQGNDCEAPTEAKYIAQLEAKLETQGRNCKFYADSTDRLEQENARLRAALKRVAAANTEVQEAKRAWEGQFATQGITVGDPACARLEKAKAEFADALVAITEAAK